MGIVVPDSRVDQALANMPADFFERLRQGRSASISRDMVRGVIADWEKVNLASEIGTGVTRVSETEVRRKARETLEKVRVHFVSLPTSLYFDGSEVIPPEELQAHFEAFKNTPQGEGEGFGYGYQIPTRLTVQYIKADIDTLLAHAGDTIRVTEDQARTYYTENKSRFRRPPPTPPTSPPLPSPLLPTTSPAATAPAATAPASRVPTTVKAAIVHAQEVVATTTQPTTRPTSRATTSPSASRPTKIPAKPTPPLYSSFDEVRSDVEQRIKREKLTELAIKAMESIQQRLYKPWYVAGRDEEGYPEAPPATATLDHYATELAAVQKRWTLARNFTVTTTKPFNASPSGASAVPGIGQTFPVDPLDRAGGFMMQIQYVKGVGTYPTGQSNTDTSLYLGTFQTSPKLLKDGDGSVYLWRVVAVDPAHAPATLQEVDFKVEADLRALHAYQKAGELAQQLRPIAREKGLDAAFNELPEDIRNRLTLMTPPPFARVIQSTRQSFSSRQPLEQPSPVQGLTGSLDSRKRFIEACFEMADAPQIAADDHRVKVLEMPEARQWVVIEWRETQPMLRVAYQSQRESIRQSLTQTLRGEALRQWFTRENVRRRTGYAPVNPPVGADDDASETPATPDATEGAE
jgi:hypothetical protein